MRLVGYGEKTNRSKSIALPSDEEMLEQGKNCWPVEWMGMLPSKWFRNAKIAKHREKQKRVFSKATKDPVRQLILFDARVCVCVCVCVFV